MVGRTDGDAAAEPRYRRSAGSSRGEARRRQLLEKVTDDLAAHGLTDFSLRRAAKAAGTSHKVLLYYFDGVDDLLAQAVPRLRERRIRSALAAAVGTAGRRSLAESVRAIWPVLREPESGLRVLDEAIGLAMYDPVRYAQLGREASAPYLPALVSLCPPEWPEARKHEVAQMILAAFRGFLAEWRITGETHGVDAGLEALVRALEREEATPG